MIRKGVPEGWAGLLLGLGGVSVSGGLGASGGFGAGGVSGDLGLVLGLEPGGGGVLNSLILHNLLPPKGMDGRLRDVVGGGVCLLEVLSLLGVSHIVLRRLHLGGDGVDEGIAVDVFLGHLQVDRGLRHLVQRRLHVRLALRRLRPGPLGAVLLAADLRHVPEAVRLLLGPLQRGGGGGELSAGLCEGLLRLQARVGGGGGVDGGDVALVDELPLRLVGLLRQLMVARHLGVQRLLRGLLREESGVPRRLEHGGLHDEVAGEDLLLRGGGGDLRHDLAAAHALLDALLAHQSHAPGLHAVLLHLHRHLVRQGAGFAGGGLPGGVVRVGIRGGVPGHLQLRLELRHLLGGGGVRVAGRQVAPLLLRELRRLLNGGFLRRDGAGALGGVRLGRQHVRLGLLRGDLRLLEEQLRLLALRGGLRELDAGSGQRAHLVLVRLRRRHKLHVRLLLDHHGVGGAGPGHDLGETSRQAAAGRSLAQRGGGEAPVGVHDRDPHGGDHREGSRGGCEPQRIAQRRAALARLLLPSEETRVLAAEHGCC
mmetsp:Transcript_813/g.1910  ORF Transcript_813/g.1910 Transcript_813/m.1910 type:complete len:538 (+) Transcript_813:272-1885(+)